MQLKLQKIYDAIALDQEQRDELAVTVAQKKEAQPVFQTLFGRQMLSETKFPAFKTRKMGYGSRLELLAAVEAELLDERKAEAATTLHQPPRPTRQK